MQFTLNSTMTALRSLPISSATQWLPIVLTVAVSMILCSCAPGAESTTRPAAFKAPSPKKVAKLIAASERAHPRLLLTDEDMQGVRKHIAADAELKATCDYLIATADGMLPLEPPKRKLEGRRLLSVSRTSLRRVMTLAFAYRMTGQHKYLDRAEKEMLAAASFDDWNPSHFLDVAEMTTALAIGYDWLYHDLSADSRKAIRDAIVNNGLRTSASSRHSRTNNWNPVCNGGMTIGALAVMEDEPDLAANIVSLSVRYVPNALHVYGPNGAYPEGPSYWEYGTTYTVLMIEAMRTALGTHFGLGDYQPLLKSANYYMHAHGPTGRYFNYSDCSEYGRLAPAAFWFARQTGHPEVLWVERRKLAALVKSDPRPHGSGRRFLPMLLAWANPAEDTPAPKQLSYHDTGVTPVGIHRTGWDEQATFVGLKAGSPYGNHSHMDIGSFVMSADGVRWAVDLGSQGYNSLESVGVDLWNYDQDGGRWTVYRPVSYTHLTLPTN